mmetsp:Transcript_23418/g.37734  ORF Transcript_23418/g.37734 Transcript_23418/m.37734 type:complete len:93 (-) Transcript_23418:484-762(-)
MSSGKHNERCNKSRRQNGSAKSLALNGPPASAGSSVNKAKRAHEAAKQMVDKEAIQKMLEGRGAQKRPKTSKTKSHQGHQGICTQIFFEQAW